LTHGVSTDGAAKQAPALAAQERLAAASAQMIFELGILFIMAPLCWRDPSGKTMAARRKLAIDASLFRETHAKRITSVLQIG
jgi:hypothetical protein